VSWWSWQHADQQAWDAVRDSAEFMPPVGPGTSMNAGQVRAEGLWADFNQEDPEGLHWSWGLEAFGVAFDDPADALGAEWGERTALGFDLEWEGPSIVHGDILVGPSERIAFDGAGRRWLDLPTQPTSEQQRGRHAPVRLQAGVLNQWLVGGDEGWVREWASDAAGAGTA
jgi:hypothetical protein